MEHDCRRVPDSSPDQHAASAPAAGHDYESGFLYLIFYGVLACCVAFWFARQVHAGRLLKLGVIEAEQFAG